MANFRCIGLTFTSSCSCSLYLSVSVEKKEQPLTPQLPLLLRKLPPRDDVLLLSLGLLLCQKYHGCGTKSWSVLMAQLHTFQICSRWVLIIWPLFFLHQALSGLFQVTLSPQRGISMAQLLALHLCLLWQTCSCVLMPGLDPICRSGDLLQHVLLLMIIVLSCKSFGVSASKLPQGYVYVQMSHGVSCPIVCLVWSAGAPHLGWGILLLRITADSS